MKRGLVIATGVLAVGLLSAGFGMQYGIGLGAQSAFGISGGSNADHELSTIRMSAAALEALELETSGVAHQQLESLLYASVHQLGLSAKTVEKSWTCSDRDRETTRAARSYFSAHPELPNRVVYLPLRGDGLFDAGLAFCSGPPPAS